MSQSEKPLDPLRKSQEEEYFRKQNAELAAKIKSRAEMQKSGVQDEKLADELTKAGFDGDSIRALFILPLIQVAWADNEVQPEERANILSVVKERGIEPNSKAYSLVSKWLSSGSDDAQYLKAKTLVEPLLGQVKTDATWVIEASERVAQATGGIFGLGIGSKTSKAEKEIIEEITKRIKG